MNCGSRCSFISFNSFIHLRTMLNNYCSSPSSARHSSTGASCRISRASMWTGHRPCWIGECRLLAPTSRLRILNPILRFRLTTISRFQVPRLAPYEPAGAPANRRPGHQRRPAERECAQWDAVRAGERLIDGCEIPGSGSGIRCMFPCPGYEIPGSGCLFPGSVEANSGSPVFKLVDVLKRNHCEN